MPLPAGFYHVPKKKGGAGGKHPRASTVHRPPLGDCVVVCNWGLVERARAKPTERTSALIAQHYTGEAISPADAPSHKHTSFYPNERSICVQMHGNAATVVRRGQVPREASALFSDADESSDDMGLPSRRSRQDKERARTQALVRSGFSDSESEPECSSNMPANRQSLRQGRAAHATKFRRTAYVGTSASAVGKQGNTALNSLARSWASRRCTTADQVSDSEYSSDDSELLSRLDLAGEGQNLPCYVHQPPLVVAFPL
jgi:hypothetical protein